MSLSTSHFSLLASNVTVMCVFPLQKQVELYMSTVMWMPHTTQLSVCLFSSLLYVQVSSCKVKWECGKKISLTSGQVCFWPYLSAFESLGLLCPPQPSVDLPGIFFPASNKHDQQDCREASSASETRTHTQQTAALSHSSWATHCLTVDTIHTFLLTRQLGDKIPLKFGCPYS